MSLPIDVQYAGLRTQAPLSLESTSARTGSMQGISVALSDDPSLLTDAAEEISTFISNSLEKREYGQRRVRAEIRLLGMTPEEVNVYFEKSKLAKDSQELTQRVRHLLRQEGAYAGQGTLGDGSSLDPTEHFLLLQLARDTARSEGASGRVLERLDAALADLEARHGSAIRAALATIDHAANYGSTAQEIKQFQKSTQVLLDQPSLHLAVKQVLELAGRHGAQFESAMHNMMGALGACVAAAETARQRALLETLVRDLYHLKSMKTLLEDCKRLLRRFRHWLPREQPDKDQEGALFE